jgi:hypothetical protein
MPALERRALGIGQRIGRGQQRGDHLGDQRPLVARCALAVEGELPAERGDQREDRQTGEHREIDPQVEAPHSVSWDLANT